MIALTGDSLTFKELQRILYNGEKVEIDHTCLETIHQSRRVVETIVQEGRTVYGINTGFGKFSDVRIDVENVEELQRNLILSHACGVGPLFSERVTKAMTLLRANALVKGYSGVRLVVIEKLLEFVNLEIYPCIPQQGSLGASGDLAPLAHLALALMGEGDVIYKGQRMSTASCFQLLEIVPLTLQAKEGLALINGTQAMTAAGAVAYMEAERLAFQAEWIAALTMEGLNGIIDAFDEDIHIARVP